MSEDITISNSRTYAVGIYDVGAPNDIRFEKVKLPLSSGNTSRHARQYYLLSHFDQAKAIRILTCMPIEDYLALVNDSLEEIIFDKPAVSGGNILKSDMEEVRIMLDKWNETHFPGPGTTYAVTMGVILQQMDFLQTQNKVLENDMKGIKEFLKNFNNK